jgi:hypothetical protein
MSRVLAAELGWVAPSERLSNTIERAQLAAYNEGSLEVNPEHLFSAILEDLDAVYFLARHEIPLTKLEESIIEAEDAVQDVPRLAPPSSDAPKPVQPHLDIPASAPLRRILAFASALAETRSMIEVHGGLILEAILEDGRFEAAAALKSAHAEIAQETGRRLPPLPGSNHQGARLVVQPPQKPEQPAPRPTLNSAEQVRWLAGEIARLLEHERPYRFLQELNAFTDKDRRFSSLAASQIREEAQAELTANPVFLCHAELQSAGRALEEADARVRQAALRVADVKPHLFNTLLTMVPEPAAAAMKAALKIRNEERAALAAALQAQAAQAVTPALPSFLDSDAQPEMVNGSGAAFAAAWVKPSFPRPVALQQELAGDEETRENGTKADHAPEISPADAHIIANRNLAKAQIKKTLARLGRLFP